MLKRLIEVALPLKEISEESAREKSIRQGHISTLHVWWARRPLATCRATVFSSLIPDPDDPNCPVAFRTLVMELLGRAEFTPRRSDGTVADDTPRNRCLEFIKHLVTWKNSAASEYVEPARNLILAAHKILHPTSDSDAPNVCDPFAGGGAIPLEALRLGCNSYAVDLNPVAHLIELCTLLYPQIHGQPHSRAVPDYIKRLIAYSRASKRGVVAPLFDKHGEPSASACGDELFPPVEISEAEYDRNPLAADVKYWGHWVQATAAKRLVPLYSSPGEAANESVFAFLWARTVKCQNPACCFTIPLVTNLWLLKKGKRRVALRMTLEPKGRSVRFTIAEGKDIDFDPDEGTMRRGSVACPSCKQVASSKYLKHECAKGDMNSQLIAVAVTTHRRSGMAFRPIVDEDVARFEVARTMVATVLQHCPTESISTRQPRLMWVTTYGMTKWVDIFNARQLTAIGTFVEAVKTALTLASKDHDADYVRALAAYHAMAIGRLCSYNSTLCRWGQEFIGNTFGRQGLPMVWNYCEAVPIGNGSGNWLGAIDSIIRVIRELSKTSTQPAQTKRGSATSMSTEDGSMEALITDPPYYDAVPTPVKVRLVSRIRG